MKCPYCGSEMEAGTFNQMDKVFWEPREKPREKGFLKSLIASINAVKPIEFKNGTEWDYYSLEVPAYHCPNCCIFLLQGRFMKDE